MNRIMRRNLPKSHRQKRNRSRCEGYDGTKSFKLFRCIQRWFQFSGGNAEKEIQFRMGANMDYSKHINAYECDETNLYTNLN